MPFLDGCVAVTAAASISGSSKAVDWSRWSCASVIRIARNRFAFVSDLCTANSRLSEPLFNDPPDLRCAVLGDAGGLFAKPGAVPSQMHDDLDRFHRVGVIRKSWQDCQRLNLRQLPESNDDAVPIVRDMPPKHQFLVPLPRHVTEGQQHPASQVYRSRVAPRRTTLVRCRRHGDAVRPRQRSGLPRGSGSPRSRSGH